MEFTFICDSVTFILTYVYVVTDKKAAKSVADLEGVPRVPWNPSFGFSCDRKLWKPGIQQNPTI